MQMPIVVCSACACIFFLFSQPSNSAQFIVAPYLQPDVQETSTKLLHSVACSEKTYFLCVHFLSGQQDTSVVKQKLPAFHSVQKYSA